MTHSKITSKGQTTVPRQVRAALNLTAGDRIIYEVRGDHVVIRRNPTVADVAGVFKGKTKRPVADYATERQAARQAQIAHVLGKETSRR